MADLATLQTRLAEAEAAYHKLQTGALEVEVEISPAGMRTKYTMANADKLQAYIEQLKSQIAGLGGSTGLTRRAIGIDL